MSSCSEQVVYAALQVLNEITHDNVDLLESACHVGLVSVNSFLLSRVLYMCIKETRVFAFDLQ